MTVSRSLSAEARGRLESAFGLLTAACVLSFIPWLALLGQSALCLLGLIASLLALLGVRGVRAALLDGLPAVGEAASAATRAEEPERERAAEKRESSVFTEPPPLSAVQLETTPTVGRKKAKEEEIVLRRKTVSEPEAVIRRKPEPATPAWTESIDWEQWAGKKLLQKAGLLIVLIGVVLLLKYSFDNKWIDELGRLVLGTAMGIGLLAAGEIFRAKYAKWAQGFTGAGLAMLYLIIWAAHTLYPEVLAAKYSLVIPDTFAVCLYGAVTALGAAAAIRYRSPVIAGFALLGGYATPFLLGEGAGSPVLLAVYLAILSAGMLAVSWKTRWPWLSAIAFILTQVELGTMVYLQPEDVVSNTVQAVIAAGFFVIFSLPPLLSQFGAKKDAEATDILLLVLNGLAALTPIVDSLGGVQEPYAGLAVLGFALFYALCAAAAVLRRGTDLALVNAYLLGAIGLVALALEIEMGWAWVAAGWAPLSVAVLLLSVRLKRGGPWVAACALLGLSALALLTNLPAHATEAWVPFLSDWAMQGYVMMASIVAWILIAPAVPERFIPESSREGAFSALYLGLGSFAGLLLLMELRWDWVVAGWAPLSVAFLLLASRVRRGGAWTAACILLALSGVALVFNVPLTDAADRAAWVPFLSDWSVQNYVLLACVGAWIVLSRRMPKEMLPEKARVPAWEGLHAAIAFFAFLALTMEVTRLDIVFTLPLTVSYLVFSAVAMGLFLLLGVRSWFCVALIAQVLVLLSVFGLGRGTGMGWESQVATPFLHPWGLTSLGAIAVTMGMAWAMRFRRFEGLPETAPRTLLVVMGLSQLWLHGTVEITHLADASRWAEVFELRVLSLWWWVFAGGVLAWSIAKESRNIRLAALALLAPPYLMAVSMLFDRTGGMVEVGLWTATGLGLCLLGAKRKWRETEIAGIALTAVTAGLDMVLHLGDRDAGVLRSSYWTGIALLAIALGFAVRSQDARRLGMALFGAAALKLLLADFAGLDVPVRIGASIVTGLLMIGASYLYQRFDESMGKKTAALSARSKPEPRSRSLS